MLSADPRHHEKSHFHKACRTSSCVRKADSLHADPRQQRRVIFTGPFTDHHLCETQTPTHHQSLLVRDLRNKHNVFHRYLDAILKWIFQDTILEHVVPNKIEIRSTSWLKAYTHYHYIFHRFFGFWIVQRADIRVRNRLCPTFK